MFDRWAIQIVQQGYGLPFLSILLHLTPISERLTEDRMLILLQEVWFYVVKGAIEWVSPLEAVTECYSCYALCQRRMEDSILFWPFTFSNPLIKSTNLRCSDWPRFFLSWRLGGSVLFAEYLFPLVGGL